MEGEETMFYNTCPKCGANLDPGEKCTCEDEEKEEKGTGTAGQPLVVESGTNQLAFNLPLERMVL